MTRYLADVLVLNLQNAFYTPENCLKLICILDAIILLLLKKNEIAKGNRTELGRICGTELA